MSAPHTPSFKEALQAIENEALTEVDGGQVVLRGDGYHWQAAGGKLEFGPYATMEEALAELAAACSEEEAEAEPGESLAEAEGELGIADWIDPDTGEPAEGLSTPRLHDE